jgi:hypothetical protein
MNFAMGMVMSDDDLEAVQRLVPIADGAGLTLPEMALAWVLRRGELSSAIVGASRPEQVHANAAASGIELSADILEAVDVALGEAPRKGQTLASSQPQASPTGPRGPRTTRRLRRLVRLGLRPARAPARHEEPRETRCSAAPGVGDDVGRWPEASGNDA